MLQTQTTGSQESILETPSYVIALVLLIFQAIAVAFTFCVNQLKTFLRRRKRWGMLAAVEHSVMELTLLGFVSLCLIGLQKPLTRICGKFMVLIAFSLIARLPRAALRHALEDIQLAFSLISTFIHLNCFHRRAGLHNDTLCFRGIASL